MIKVKVMLMSAYELDKDQLKDVNKGELYEKAHTYGRINRNCEEGVNSSPLPKIGYRFTLSLYYFSFLFS